MGTEVEEAQSYVEVLIRHLREDEAEGCRSWCQILVAGSENNLLSPVFLSASPSNPSFQATVGGIAEFMWCWKGLVSGDGEKTGIEYMHTLLRL